MPPNRFSFLALNTSEESIPDCMGSFSLTATPNTDLWRKFPSCDTVTAPILYTAMRYMFTCAEVTVSGNWELEWDQAGLVIFAGDLPLGPHIVSPADGDALPSYPLVGQPSRWVKVGLEMSDLTCHASSVCATSEGADHSLTALPPHQRHSGHLRLKIERVGTSLWVWYEDSLAGWKKIRDVTWFFGNVEDKAVRVGVYASRPASFPTSRITDRPGSQSPTHRDLNVQFHDLEIF